MLMNGVVEPSGTETLNMLNILLSLIIIQTTYSWSYIFKIIFEDIFILCTSLIKFLPPPLFV